MKAAAFLQLINDPRFNPNQLIIRDGLLHIASDADKPAKLDEVVKLIQKMMEEYGATSSQLHIEDHRRCLTGITQLNDEIKRQNTSIDRNRGDLPLGEINTQFIEKEIDRLELEQTSAAKIQHLINRDQAARRIQRTFRQRNETIKDEFSRKIQQPPPFLYPSEIKQRFDYKKFLGVGGEGAVYQVLDNIDDKMRAYKSPSLRGMNPKIQRVIEHASKYHTPHLTNVKGSFETQSLPAFLDRIPNEGSLSREEAAAKLIHATYSLDEFKRMEQSMQQRTAEMCRVTYDPDHIEEVYNKIAEKLHPPIPESALNKMVQRTREFNPNINKSDDLIQRGIVDRAKLGRRKHIAVMELMDGDLDAIQKELSLEQKIQIETVMSLLDNLYATRVGDFKLSNVFYKRLTPEDTFRGEKLMDYDFWHYQIGEDHFYIPRQEILIKLGDYDDWECHFDPKKPPDYTNIAGRTYQMSQEEITSAKKLFSKPNDPNAKVLDMTPHLKAKEIAQPEENTNRGLKT